MGALTSSTYPLDDVRIACSRCGREGRYRRESLVERFGPRRPMPDVLAERAACKRRSNASDPCGAHYPDLVGRRCN